MGARVIALGQRLAGDDAAGLAVGDRLRAQGLEVIEVSDAADLVALLEAPGDVVIVDAVIGGAPGRVIDLAIDDLASNGLAAVSTHGIDVPTAVALARALSPSTVARVHLVGITIDHAPRFTEGCSPEVDHVLDEAAARVRALCR